MSVYPTEIFVYGSSNMPEADSLTVGGAADLTRLVSFSDMAANGLVDYVSSASGDTATKMQISGLDGSGIQQTPAAITLTGTTKVAGTQTFNRLLYGAATGATANGPLSNPGGTAATGDLAIMAHTLTITAHTCQTGSANATGVTPALIKLQSGDGASVTLGMVIRTTGGTGPSQIRYACSTSGTGAGQYGTDIIAVNRNWGTVPDNTTTYEVATGMVFPILPNPITAVIRPFSGVSADIVGGSTHIYYEKFAVLNTDGTTAWTAATLIKQVDPSGLYAGGGALDINPCSALNDTNSTTNRQTVPSSGIGSWSSGAAPQTITLAAQTSASNTAAQAQCFWARLTLAAGQAPANTSVDFRPSGTTT
jgi:hypothetical protein